MAKRVHNESSISQGRISVSSVAVDFAEKVIGELKGRKVLIVGAGETGEQTLTHLIERGAKMAMVANRTLERAKELAARRGGEAISFDELPQRLAQADIIISSTGAPHYVIRAEHVRKALPNRNNRPLVFIDIAVPRDIDPAIQSIDNAYLYNIDELESVVSENRAAREEDLAICLKIVEDEAAQFMKATSARIAGPVLQQIEDAAKTVQQEEVRRLMAKLDHLSEKDREEIQYAIHRVANKILHAPKTAISQSAREEHGHTVIEMVRKLFGLSQE